MAIPLSVKHTKVSVKDDGPDSAFVRPSDWNAMHTFVAPAASIIGRDNSGDGPAQALVLDHELTDPCSVPTTDHVLALIAAAIALQTPTGVIRPFVGAAANAGWVLLDGRTLGNATSGASSRANADAEMLFRLLWDRCTNTECPVIGGRGSTASSDFAASKRITLPDARGRVLAGLDNMGGTASNRLTVAGGGVDGATLAAFGGAQSVTLDGTQIPAHAHGIVFDRPFQSNAGLTGGGTAMVGTGEVITSTNTDGGGGLAHPNVQPTLVVAFEIKL